MFRTNMFSLPVDSNQPYVNMKGYF